jgi:hypothetical protein
MFLAYCNSYENDIKAPIYHLTTRKIEKYFLCWLIECKYLILTSGERSDLSYILNSYRSYISDLKSTKIIPFK